MRRLFLSCLAIATALSSQPAAAHPEYFWRQHDVDLTPAQARRIADLERRAVAAGAGRVAPSWLATAVAQLGNCALAERLMRDRTLPPPAFVHALYATADAPDRECARRAIGMIADAARRSDDLHLSASALYSAGHLWRRIGDSEKGFAAIAEAERLYDADEAERGDRVWSCHGGNCISSRWFTRLDGLRLVHGTPLWREELHRLADLAAPGLRSDPQRRAPVFIGQAVFERLVSEAAAHDEEAIGLRLAPGTVYGDPRAYFAARMHALLAEGRAAEAVALLPRAGRAFQGGDPRVIAEHYEAFAAVDGFYQRFARYNFNDSALAIVRALMERGDLRNAALAVAAARTSVAADPRSIPPGYAAMEGLAAFLDDPRAPLARLAATGRGSRDHQHAELALFQASRGDWPGFEAAFAAVRDDRVRARVRSELSCRAGAAGEGAALRALERAGPLRPGDDSEDERSAFGGYVYQSFACHLRRGHGDAAIAYVQAVAPVRLKLTTAAGLPIWSSLADPARVRRRLADIAFAHAERHDLRTAPEMEALAVEFERLGDYRQADRIVARVQDPVERAQMLVGLIDSYVPEPER